MSKKQATKAGTKPATTAKPAAATSKSAGQESTGKEKGGHKVDNVPTGLGEASGPEVRILDKDSAASTGTKEPAKSDSEETPTGDPSRHQTPTGDPAAKVTSKEESNVEKDTAVGESDISSYDFGESEFSEALGDSGHDVGVLKNGTKHDVVVLHKSTPRNQWSPYMLNTLDDDVASPSFRLQGTAKEIKAKLSKEQK